MSSALGDVADGFDGRIAELAMKLKVHRVFFQGVTLDAVHNTGQSNVFGLSIDVEIETDTHVPTDEVSDRFRIFGLKIKRQSSLGNIPELCGCRARHPKPTAGKRLWC